LYKYNNKGYISTKEDTVHIIPTSQLIWRLFLKYGSSGPVLKKQDSNRRRIYVQKKQKDLRKTTSRYFILQKLFFEEYVTREKGLKHLAKEYNLTYTEVRGLIEFLNIEIRKGRDVVTERVKKFRSAKAIREHKSGTGFFDSNIRRKIEKYNARGVQGYYFNRSKNKQVWLRSTYEYIFAKWLDKTNHVWDTEIQCYSMDDSGVIYRPDFFIYDELGSVKKIVEIKGYWDSNTHKAIKLNEMLDIDVIVIANIEKFIESNSSYNKELQEWKEKRIND